MTTALILLALGLLVIFLEFFLPGGILGVAGGILLIVGIVFFATATDSILLIFSYLILNIILLIVLITFTLRRIKKGRSKGIYLDSAQEGYMASEFDKALIGKSGEALTDLRPAGHILVDGKRYQAVSKTGYLEKGSKIEIVAGEGAHFIVKGII